jgi:SAM-dependent methyltransferase
MMSAHPPTPGSPLRLPWPLPALLAWAAGWALWLGAGAAGAPPLPALAAAVAVAWAVAWPCRGGWRRLIAGAGFPLSALALGLAGHWPAWLWLLLLLPLLAAYPLRAWRDAPFFPTPADALAGIAAVTGAPRRVLDAGCGLGHGLAALRRLWPQAELEGVEWSPVLAWLAARRCPGARIKRGDMWARSWAGYDLVYLFQRPESMARAWAKAEQELDAGAWLVSLEFAVPDRRPWACVQAPGRRPVWIYHPAAANQHSTAALSRR